MIAEYLTSFILLIERNIYKKVSKEFFFFDHRLNFPKHNN